MVAGGLVRRGSDGVSSLLEPGEVDPDHARKVVRFAKVGGGGCWPYAGAQRRMGQGTSLLLAPGEGLASPRAQGGALRQGEEQSAPTYKKLWVSMHPR